jgi:hypothetical protein
MEQQTQSQTQEEISIKDTQAKSDLKNYLENINIQYVTKEIKKVTPLIDIPQNLKYNINNIRKSKTKHGDKLIIDVSYNCLGMNLEYYVYLPDRYISLSKENIDIFIRNPNIYFLYKGKYNNGRHQVNFVA